jgi:dTDP-4-dehydrorhamnose 3,5-epimerase
MYLPRIITPQKYFDDRGWFTESFHEMRLMEMGISFKCVQENQSFSKRAKTLRGMHFQSPPAAQAKLVSVLRGRIFDVVVDIRHGSPTFGKHISIELSAESGQQLYVPIGFAHGFLTLENDVTVMYKVSSHYAPAHESGIRWNDPELALEWPSEGADVITSDKDEGLPLLSELVSPFVYDGNPLPSLIARFADL